MRTQKQIETSRANGALSNGPVTEEGKKISSRNSLRHGILADSVVLVGESKVAFMEMMDKLVAELQPITETETALVDELGHARWRQMRVWSVAKASFDKQMLHQTSGSGPERLAKVYELHGESIASNHRYDVSFGRIQKSALRLLEWAKTNRPSDLEETTGNEIMQAGATWKTGPFPGDG